MASQFESADTSVAHRPEHQLLDASALGRESNSQSRESNKREQHSENEKQVAGGTLPNLKIEDIHAPKNYIKGPEDALDKCKVEAPPFMFDHLMEINNGNRQNVETAQTMQKLFDKYTQSTDGNSLSKKSTLSLDDLNKLAKDGTLNADEKKALELFKLDLPDVQKRGDTTIDQKTLDKWKTFEFGKNTLMVDAMEEAKLVQKKLDDAQTGFDRLRSSDGPDGTVSKQAIDMMLKYMRPTDEERRGLQYLSDNYDAIKGPDGLIRQDNIDKFGASQFDDVRKKLLNDYTDFQDCVNKGN